MSSSSSVSVSSSLSSGAFGFPVEAVQTTTPPSPKLIKSTTEFQGFVSRRPKGFGFVEMDPSVSKPSESDKSLRPLKGFGFVEMEPCSPGKPLPEWTKPPTEVRGFGSIDVNDSSPVSILKDKVLKIKEQQRLEFLQSFNAPPKSIRCIGVMLSDGSLA